MVNQDFHVKAALWTPKMAGRTASTMGKCPSPDKVPMLVSDLFGVHNYVSTGV